MTTSTAHASPMTGSRCSEAEHRMSPGAQVRVRTWAPGTRFSIARSDPVTHSPIRVLLSQRGGVVLDGVPEPVWFPGPLGECAHLFELIHRVHLDGDEHPMRLSDRWMEANR